MKKALLVVLGIVVVNVTTQGQQADEYADLKETILLDVCSGHQEPADDDGVFPPAPPTVKEIVGDMSPELVARIMEEIVRERISVLDKKKGIAKIYPLREIQTLLSEFSSFQNENTLAFLRECALSHELRSAEEVIISEGWGSALFQNAVQSYITLSGGGGDSISLLQEVIAKGHLKIFDRYLLYKHLESFIEQLKGKGQAADIEKIYAFMKEMVQTEQHLGSVQELDKILCTHLVSYADDPLRQHVLKRIEVMAEEARKQMEIRDKELEEFNEGLRRQRGEREAQRTAPKPAQPPEATTPELSYKNGNIISPPSQTKQPGAVPVGEKGVPWKLPLLIGIIVIGGAVAVWRCFRRKQT